MQASPRYAYHPAEMTDRTLTELEGCVLGVFVKKGPCTPYVVRKEFLQSQTPFWSGSAGAVYPLINRLSGENLIKKVSAKSDGRNGQLYVITSKGERRLRRWLNMPKSSIVIGPPPDPLRNRIEFLGSLEPENRREFLNEMRASLEDHLAKGIAEVERHDRSNYFEYLSLLAQRAATKARLEWVIQITADLEKKRLL